MKCQKCGHSLPEDSEFCQYCGARLELQPPLEEASASPSEDAPIFTETVLPVEPLAVELPKRSDSGKRQILVPLVLLSVLLAVSIGFNAMQYIRDKETTETVALQAVRIGELERTVTEQNTRISAQEATISEQKAVIPSFVRRARCFDTICRELSSGNIGYAANNFKASESVIVVDRNEQNRKFTLTANRTAGESVFVNYSRPNVAAVTFDSNSWTTSTTVTIHPWQAGVTSVTFSNSSDLKTFKVLIIVTG